MIKLLWASHYHGYTTSQGLVTNYILNELSRNKDFELIELAWCYSGTFNKLPEPSWKIYYVKQHPYFKDLFDKIIEYEKPDCVLAFSDIVYWQYCLNVLPYIRCLYKFIGYWYQEGNDISKKYKQLLDAADGLIVDHPCGYDVVVNRFPDLKPKLYTVMHGIDRKIFKPCSKEEKINIRKRYKFFNEDDVIFFFNGRNLVRKQIPLLMKAFSIVSREINNAKLVILSNDGEAFNLAERKDRYGIDGKCFIVDKHQEWGLNHRTVASLYQMSDIYVTAAMSEAFDFTVLEAMACGVPFIACEDIPVEKYWMDRSNAGCLVSSCGYFAAENCDIPVINYKDLADKMIHLAKDKDKREQLGKNGHKFIKNTPELTWNYSAQKLSKVINEVCGKVKASNTISYQVV